MKQFSLLEIISTATVLLAMVVESSSLPCCWLSYTSMCPQVHTCPLWNASCTSCTSNTYPQQSAASAPNCSSIPWMTYSPFGTTWHPPLVAFSFLEFLHGGGVQKEEENPMLWEFLFSCSFSLFSCSFGKCQKEPQIWGKIKEKEKLAKLLLFYVDSLTLVKVSSQHKTVVVGRPFLSRLS